MSNRDKYTQVFKEVFDVDESVLNENFNFKDVDDWTSVTHLILISELEFAFDVMFETEDILHFGGFENGMKILRSYGVEI